MARAYTLTTVALTLGVSPKWLDNVLSHHQVFGVEQSRQGIARRLSIDGIVVLGVAVLLMHELSLPTRAAIELAQRMSILDGRFDSPRGLTVTFDLTDFRARVLEQLESAVEVAPVPRRGRPPANKTGRLV
jgi:hypothetical protein